MSYPWINPKRLASLKVDGVGNSLSYEADGERAEVILKGNDIERVIVSVKGIAHTVTPDEAKHLVVGEGNARRDVWHYLKPDGPARELRIGITKHTGMGTWSSLPHDFELIPDTGFEEVFFYLLSGGPQRAHQVCRGLWHDGTEVDEVYVARDRTFATIPLGYHPVVGQPDVHVSYVWAYLAKKKTWEKI